MKDIAVIGGGISGMAVATRLQARGLSTVVLEAHGQIGGCAGFYRRKGFAFDVGATTLVDFEPDGVGGEWLDGIGFEGMQGEALPGYMAWLPDRQVALYRDHALWAAERLAALGDSAAHRAFWTFLDNFAHVFWQASRQGIKLPMRTPVDALRNLQAVSLDGLALARYIYWTMGDALRHFGLREDQPLTALLAMLVEDTVHSTLDEAPLINAALGVTIRGAGLTRHKGGMYGFWKRLLAHYRAQGGELHVGCRVERVSGSQGEFTVHTRRGDFHAGQVVSTIPVWQTVSIAPQPVGKALAPYLRRDAEKLGGAMVVCLGVSEDQVGGQEFTHHQLFQDYTQPLGNGNNMFISVSAPGDTESAPAGYRAVMVSTHCELEAWEGLSQHDYDLQKQASLDALLRYARRVYPALGDNAVVCEIGTPRTYELYTGRFRGAVGGVRQTLQNANQNAIPYNLGMRGFWLAGDSTWPGLGTVACVLASRHIADGAANLARRLKICPFRRVARRNFKEAYS